MSSSAATNCPNCSTTDDYLAVESAHFTSMRNELVESHPGEWALIVGEAVIGMFDTNTQAWRAGYRRFGPEGAFFVGHAVAEQEDCASVGLLLG